MNWWNRQLERIKTFAEIVVILGLDAGLILVVWSLRILVIYIIGVDPNTIQDPKVFWAVRLSEVSGIVILSLYIIADVARHLLKAFQEIRCNLTSMTLQTSLAEAEQAKITDIVHR
jgi:hypothetical protein